MPFLSTRFAQATNTSNLKKPHFSDPKPSPRPAFSTGRFAKPAPTSTQGNERPTHVSLAGILRPKSTNTVVKKQIRHKRREVLHPIFTAYLESKDEYRGGLKKAALTAVEEIHDEFMTELGEIKKENDETAQKIRAIEKEAFIPLSDVEIDVTQTDSSGQKISTVCSVGEVLEEFHAAFEHTEAEMKSHWAEWESTQAKLKEIEQDILGKPNHNGKGKAGETISSQIRALEDDLDKKVAVLMEEIKEAGKEFTDNLNAIEKEFDARLRADEAEVLRALFQAHR